MSSGETLRHEATRGARGHEREAQYQTICMRWYMSFLSISW